jgi:hypothetical protein
VVGACSGGIWAPRSGRSRSGSRCQTNRSNARPPDGCPSPTAASRCTAAFAWMRSGELANRHARKGRPAGAPDPRPGRLQPWRGEAWHRDFCSSQMQARRHRRQRGSLLVLSRSSPT